MVLTSTELMVQRAPGPAASTLPPCAAADLALSFDGKDGDANGLQRGGTLMVVRNRGANRCRIPALPRIGFAGPGGTALPIHFNPPLGLHPGPAVPPVGLASGATATAELRWSSDDAPSGGRCYGTATIRVTFGAAVVDAPFTGQFCGPAAGAGFGQSWVKPESE